MAVTAKGVLRPIDPATLEPVGSVRATPSEEITELVSEGELGQRRWAETSHAERRRLFVRTARGKRLLELYVSELSFALETRAVLVLTGDVRGLRSRPSSGAVVVPVWRGGAGRLSRAERRPVRLGLGQRAAAAWEHRRGLPELGRRRVSG